MAYLVSYASAGCLPEYTERYETLFNAVNAVAMYWEDQAWDLPEWTQDEATGKSPGDWTDAAMQAIKTIEGITELPAKVDAPEPGSLYSWTIEKIS